MPLDPQVRTVVDAMPPDAPTMRELGPEQARSLFRALSLSRQGDAEPLSRVEDRTVPGPAGEIPVRIYWPERPRPDPPLIVFFHGGGWVICDLDTHDPIARRLANGAGAVVVSVDYRLAPEHRFPAAIDDVYAATAWAVDHAHDLGADGSRLAVAGDSAGGNLAAVVAQAARDRGGPPIAFQVLVYPVTNHDFTTTSYDENRSGYFLTLDDMRFFWECYLGEEGNGADPLASPLRATHFGDLPPALVMTAEFDPLRDEGEAYAHALSDAGVAVTCTRYEGMVHGFFGMTTLFDRAHDAQAEAVAALREALGT